MHLLHLRVLALAAAGALAPLVASEATAQHSDIAIGERDGKIVYEHSSVGRVFGGAFGTSGLFEQTTSNPGFATEAGEGFVMPSGVAIDYNILGPLTYHDGMDFAPVPADASITIHDNPAGSLVINAMTVGPVTGPRFISQASGSGSIHSHIDFDLNPLSLDAMEYGAYGLLMEFSTYVDSPVSLVNSDPFYLVFNFGLEGSQFSRALGDFAVRVPEPASIAFVGLGAVVVGCFRRGRPL